MLLPAACLFLRRYKSRTDDKQPISVSVDSVRLDTLQIVIAHTIYSRVTTPDRKITPVEYELWFIRPSSRSITAQLRLLLFPRASSNSVSWWLCALSLPTTGFLARLSVSLQICLPDSSLKFWKLVTWGRNLSLSGIIPKSLFLFPYAAPPYKCTLKRDRKNKGITARTERKLYGVNFPLATYILYSKWGKCSCNK